LNNSDSLKYVPLAIAALVWGGVSYLYHPSIALVSAGTMIGIGLSALIFWSSSKIPPGKWWVVKIAAISTVAGLMNSTALDIFYTLFSAPEGNRFVVWIEMVGTGLVLTAVALANRFIGSKPEK
jgi:RsiW-degrading membrane proteinase PrsW (M82 family)